MAPGEYRSEIEKTTRDYDRYQTSYRVSQLEAKLEKVYRDMYGDPGKRSLRAEVAQLQDLIDGLQERVKRIELTPSTHGPCSCEPTYSEPLAKRIPEYSCPDCGFDLEPSDYLPDGHLKCKNIDCMVSIVSINKYKEEWVQKCQKNNT